MRGIVRHLGLQREQKARSHSYGSSNNTSTRKGFNMRIFKTMVFALLMVSVITSTNHTLMSNSYNTTYNTSKSYGVVRIGEGHFYANIYRYPQKRESSGSTDKLSWRIRLLAQVSDNLKSKVEHIKAEGTVYTWERDLMDYSSYRLKVNKSQEFEKIISPKTKNKKTLLKYFVYKTEAMKYQKNSIVVEINAKLKLKGDPREYRVSARTVSKQNN